MTEAGGGTFGDVGLHLLPVIAVVADFLAITAYRQQTLQLLDLGECVLQFAHLFAEPMLETEDAASDLQPCPQLLAVERFGDIVVGAAVQSGDHVGLGRPRRHQDDIQVRQRRRCADLVAQFQTVEAGHHPVEQRQRHPLALQSVPRGRSVNGHDDIVFPTAQRDLQHASRNRVIICNQNFHSVVSIQSASCTRVRDASPNNGRFAIQG